MKGEPDTGGGGHGPVKPNLTRQISALNELGGGKERTKDNRESGNGGEEIILYLVNILLCFLLPSPFPHLPPPFHHFLPAFCWLRLIVREFE